MAKDMTGTLLTLGAVGVGGYFLYEWLMTPSAPAVTPVTTPVTTSGGTTVTTPASTSSTTAAGTTTTTTTTTPPPALPSLSSLATAIQAGAATDPNFTGSPLQSSGYRWNTYLNIALQGTGLATPTPASFDLSQAMTFAQFWAGMAPALTAAYGLSGLMGLMGYVARANGLGDDSTDDSGGITLPYAPGGAQVIPTNGVYAPAGAVCPGDPSCPTTPNNSLIWLAVGAVGLLALIPLMEHR